MENWLRSIDNPVPIHIDSRGAGPLQGSAASLLGCSDKALDRS